MQLYTDEPSRFALFALQPRHWKAGVFLGVSFLVVMWLSEQFIPHPATLFPASALALSILFLEGIELWPVVYVSALLGYFLLGSQPLTLIILPIAQVLQAVIGAYLLRIAKVDPLLRRSRYIFLIILIIIPVSLIVPTLTSFANSLNTLYFGAPAGASSWGSRYIGSIFCLLILTPFLLRWLAKPRFGRTANEIVEIVLVFIVLMGLDYLLFIRGVEILGGIPVVYFLFVPLFWTALRLRPRFVTLALFITSAFAVCGLYISPLAGTVGMFGARLFEVEELLIVISAIFLIIGSLEEDRRLNSNLMRSQMATLENAVARISSESNAKNSFIAILAHELRNPLAPIVTAIDVMRLKTGRDPEEMETLAMMEDRMRSVRRILDDLLDISRITEGKVSLKKARINLEDVLKRSILSTEHLVKERHQALVFKVSEESMFVEGDPVRLEQVFSNLLTNASKFSESGGQITIFMNNRDGQAEIVVNDTGVGIEAAVLDKIFTPFHQVSLEEQNKNGVGIGLALVRGFVEMHKGTVVATSEGAGKGSQFTVLLPLASLVAMPKPQPEPCTISIDTLTPKSSAALHVLIVDDNDAAAASMGRLLELKGCVVSYAYDGRRAIEQADALNPEVILLDIGLPDQDGYAVAKTIRARGYHGRLIALTGYSTEDARTKGRDAGFEHYLIKPAGFEDLKRVIPEIA